MKLPNSSTPLVVVTVFVAKVEVVFCSALSIFVQGKLALPHHKSVATYAYQILLFTKTLIIKFLSKVHQFPSSVLIQIL